MKKRRNRGKHSYEQKTASFWKRVKRGTTEECWPWTACIAANGYGKFVPAQRENLLPHRFSYALHFGTIPSGMMVCHKCDNRRCCNPSHLFLGTHQDNMDDGVRKGRFLYGSKHHNAKLSEDDVRSIRSLYVPRKYTLARIASEFGIRLQTVWAIVNNKRWLRTTA